MSWLARAVVGATVVALVAGMASAQQFPEKPIRWVLGFPAGGASDLLARVVAQHLSEQFGQQVVIENKPGASGIIAAGLVAQSAGDGHTILLVSNSYINNIAFGKRFTFQPIDDFTMVTRLTVVPNVVVVPPSSSVKSIQDLIGLAKAKPGGLTYASGGIGTGTHMGTELFKAMAGVDIVHAPYKGTPPALLDLMAARVQVMFAGLPPTLQYVQTGKLRAIGVTSSERSPELPDVPTVAETLPGYEAVTWYGVFAPKGTQQALIEKLNAAFRRALTSPDVKAQLAKQGFTPAPTRPDEFLALIRKEISDTTKLVKDAGIQVN
jgi:tripartite-type tricarboxylate transporter receptor subunit TctC